MLYVTKYDKKISVPEWDTGLQEKNISVVIVV